RSVGRRERSRGLHVLRVGVMVQTGTTVIRVWPAGGSWRRSDQPTVPIPSLLHAQRDITTRPPSKREVAGSNPAGGADDAPGRTPQDETWLLGRRRRCGTGLLVVVPVVVLPGR